ncbi:MAG: hypothetical protein ACI9OJ_004117, partial [Myxococcota bacterium]
MAQSISSLLLIFLVVGCGSDSEPAGTPVDAGTTTDSTVVETDTIETSEDAAASPDAVQDVAVDASDGTNGEPDASEDTAGAEVLEVVLCEDGLPMRSFEAGGTGTQRHQLAANFSITRQDTKLWDLSKQWTGCDVYVFIPQTTPVSATDATSFWENETHIIDLLTRSPRNVHYFFVTRTQTVEAGQGIAAAMAERIGSALVKMGQAESAYWWPRLHVPSETLSELTPWLSAALAGGIGQSGFAIDRHQRLRGIGSMADVNLYDSALAGADQWPWKANIAYAAHDAAYLNSEAGHEAADALVLALSDTLEIQVFDGQVLEEFEETSVTLPSAEELAAYDTFEIHVDMRCPNPDAPEPGNCGAWDYLAHLSVYEGIPGEEGTTRTELGRFITSYHRETRWTHDVTPMMLHLSEGGTRDFRWEFAPSWNKQPTETRLSLRFSNQQKADRPFALVPLHF